MNTSDCTLIIFFISECDCCCRTVTLWSQWSKNGRRNYFIAESAEIEMCVNTSL